MIKSFQDKQTANLYAGKRTKFDSRIMKRAIVRLDRIAAAEQLDDLRVPPSNHLEALSGNREGQHSIRINDQWRVCFRWTENGVLDVEITDYHEQPKPLLGRNLIL